MRAFEVYKSDVAYSMMEFFKSLSPFSHNFISKTFFNLVDCQAEGQTCIQIRSQLLNVKYFNIQVNLNYVIISIFLSGKSTY